MATYKDRNGLAWQVNLDVVSLAKVRDLHGIELSKVMDRDPLVKLRLDPEKLVAVLQVLCQDQIDKKSTDPARDEDFGRAADTSSMLDALTEAIVEFFPSGQASLVKEVLAKHEQMQNVDKDLMLAKMDKVLMDQNLKDQLASKFDIEVDAEIERMLRSSSRQDLSNITAVR